MKHALQAGQGVRVLAVQFQELRVDIRGAGVVLPFFERGRALKGQCPPRLRAVGHPRQPRENLRLFLPLAALSKQPFQLDQRARVRLALGGIAQHLQRGVLVTRLFVGPGEPQEQLDAVLSRGRGGQTSLEEVQPLPRFAGPAIEGLERSAVAPSSGVT